MPLFNAMHAAQSSYVCRVHDNSSPFLHLTLTRHLFFTKAARQAVMSNARCLTEGINVPTVDMVAFLTPKRSKVDIVQAVGQAMRNAPGKTTGDILVPQYVEKTQERRFR